MNNLARWWGPQSLRSFSCISVSGNELWAGIPEQQDSWVPVHHRRVVVIETLESAPTCPEQEPALRHGQAGNLLSVTFCVSHAAIQRCFPLLGLRVLTSRLVYSNDQASGWPNMLRSGRAKQSVLWCQELRRSRSSRLQVKGEGRLSNRKDPITLQADSVHPSIPPSNLFYPSIIYRYSSWNYLNNIHIQFNKIIYKYWIILL